MDCSFAGESMPKVKKASKGKSVKKAQVPVPGLKQVADVRKEIISFLSLEEPQRVAIIADNDPDGFTAAIQMKKFLDSKGHDSIIFFYDHYARTSLRFLDLFVSFAPQKTIFLDLGDSLVSECLEAVGHYTGPFVSIDHHLAQGIKNAEFPFSVIKPPVFSAVEPSQYPVSKMIFDLFSGVDWLCSVGLLGDSSEKKWPAVLRNAEKNHKVSSEELRSLESLIRVVMTQYPDRKQELFVEFYKAEKPQDLFNSSFFELKKEYDAKLKALEKEYHLKAERVPSIDLVFFEAKHNLSGTLINKISRENPSTTLVFYEKPGNFYKSSFRRQDMKVNCREMAELSVKGFKDSGGGGHVVASGATFPADKLQEFKKRIIEYLEKNYKK